jgi:RNA polymerase sigma-70 factor, ECF subfamily
VPLVEPSALAVAEVVALARSNTPAAIAMLYEWFAADLLRLTARLLGSTDDAQDVVHDLFVGLPEALARYEERGTLRAWLRVTAIGMARMHVRRDQRHTTILERDMTTATPRDGLRVDDALRVDIHRAVAALPASLRQVFVLKQWEGYTHDEIGALLGISSGASRVRHARALADLRAFLDD